jgi:hypothetical protein
MLITKVVIATDLPVSNAACVNVVRK